MENNSIRKFTCSDCLEVSEVDWSKVRPDLDDGTSNIEIHAKGNDYAYYGECMNCGNLEEIEPPVPDLYVSNVDVDKSGISIEITDKVTNRSLWIDAWKSDNEEDWEYDFNQYIFHLDNENDIVAKMFQEDLGNYSEEVFDCVMGAIDDYEEEYNKLQENKTPTMRDRLKKVKTENAEINQYKQRFIDYCKGKVEDLGTLILSGEDDEDELPIALISNQYSQAKPAYILLPEDDVLMVSDKNGKVFIDSPMSNVIGEVQEMKFDKIDTEFYNQVLEDWDDFYMDDAFELNDVDKAQREKIQNEFKCPEHFDYNVISRAGGADVEVYCKDISDLKAMTTTMNENGDYVQTYFDIDGLWQVNEVDENGKYVKHLYINGWQEAMNTLVQQYNKVKGIIESKKVKKENKQNITEDTTSSEFTLLVRPDELEFVNTSALAFDSDTTIAVYKDGTYELSLIVRGSIKIVNKENGDVYKNWQSYPEDLKELVTSGEIEHGGETDKYIVEMNNWFEWFLDKVEDNEADNVWYDVADIEGMLNKPTPEENEKELEIIMKDIFNDIIEQLDEGKKEEAKFKDKVKAIKKSLKKNDKRLSDETAKKSAEKIAGSMIKKRKLNM